MGTFNFGGWRFPLALTVAACMAVPTILYGFGCEVVRRARVVGRP